RCPRSTRPPSVRRRTRRPVRPRRPPTTRRRADMAAPLKPQKVTANGKDSWFWVPAIADTAAPTAAEINAASGVNITCFLLAEQDGVTGTAEKVALARLLCETSTTEALGDQTWSLADLQGVFDPQAAAGSTGKK